MLILGRYQHLHKDAKVVVAVQSLSCGFYSYVNDKLQFRPELEWKTEGGVAKFVKDTLIVMFNDHGSPKRIEILYRTIESIIISTQLPALTLTLWETPRLFEERDQSLTKLMASMNLQQRAHIPSRTRLSELPHDTQSHRTICGQSLVYRLGVPGAEFDRTIKQLLELDRFPTSHYDFPAFPLHEQRSLVEGLKSFDKAVQDFANTVPFGVLFQLVALVRNGFLLPWTVETLLVRIARITKGRQKTSEEGATEVCSVTRYKAVKQVTDL